MRTSLILGGSRFLGFHLSLRLIELGFKVSHFRRGLTTPPNPIDGVQLFVGDRNSPADFHLPFNRTYDLVIDLSGYEWSQVSPLLSFSDRFQKYIFCSTSSVIDHKVSMPYTEEAKTVEVDDTYGGKKREIELRLFNSELGKQKRLTIFRPQGIFGRFDFAQPGILFEKISKGKEVFAFPTKLDSKLNLLDVEDFCSAILADIERKSDSSEIFNLANDTPVSLKELIDFCGMICGKKPKVRQGSMETPDWWHSYDLIANNNKAKSLLKVRFTPLRSSLENAYRHWRYDRSLLQRIKRRLLIR